MARRVIFHVGLPKTGTTYLQTILWNNRDILREQGILLPGRSVRQHLWASGVVREDPRLSRRSPHAPGAWDRLLKAVHAWPGTALVSHEFFAGASQEQAARAIEAVDAGEVEIVLTARETLGLVTARWQEFVKNGSTVGIDGYPTREETNPAYEWDWGTMDAADVLSRWGATLPKDRVHLITLPGPGWPRDELWRRFAGVLDIDPDSCDLGGSEQNESLGVVEVELLRRVNADLDGFDSALDRGMWIRGYLAQGKLVPRRGEKFWPGPERVQVLQERSRSVVDRIRDAGYDVIGDLDDLLPADVLPPRRHPDSVTDTELLGVATQTIAGMLADVRELTQQLRESQRELAAARKTGTGPVGRSRERIRRGGSGLARRVSRRFPRGASRLRSIRGAGPGN